jgi:hypothetical protein
MSSPEASPFLLGARAWLAGEVDDSVCPGCGYDWSCTPRQACMEIAASPAAYAELLRDRDGMAPAPDGGWNATGYVWHLTDLARSWAERWIQLADSPGSVLVGWDPDVVAEARGYRMLPTVSGLWALSTATETFVHLTVRLDPDTPFVHGDWGQGTIGDGTRWLAHEYVHHRIDVRARAV